MNQVNLKGNLTKDPVLREVNALGKTTTVANFTVAVSRYFNKADGTKNKDTTFILCEAWDSGAETIGKILKKGDPVLLTGSIKQENWEQDGTKRTTYKVRVERFEKLYRSLKGDDADENPTDDAAPEPVTADDGVGEGEDIPF